MKNDDAGSLPAGIAGARGTLGLAADVVSLVTFLGATVALVRGDDLPQSILAVYLCLVVTVLLVWVIRLEARNSRRAKQAAALPRLVDAIDEISHATRALLAGGSDDAYVATVKIALGHVAAVYAIATGGPCRVTLKTTYRPPGHRQRRDLAVATVCRSSGEPGGESPTGIDWINDNTDFRKIFNEGAPVFFCNDLPAEIPRGYRNSHFTEEVVASGDFPYRATIVWPVRGRITSGTAQVTRWEVIGFLCVDTLRADTFHRETDVAPGEACAHALYSGLLRYRENQADPPHGGNRKDRRPR